MPVSAFVAQVSLLRKRVAHRARFQLRQFLLVERYLIAVAISTLDLPANANPVFLIVSGTL